MRANVNAYRYAARRLGLESLKTHLYHFGHNIIIEDVSTARLDVSTTRLDKVP